MCPLAQHPPPCLGELALSASCRPPQIKLQSSDSQIFEVEEDVANESITVKNMIEGEKLTQGMAPLPAAAPPAAPA